MVELVKENARGIAPLFTFTNMTLVHSFLDGCMGRGWADDADKPTCARITVGDFSFVAGDASAPEAEALVYSLPGGRDGSFAIFIPQNSAWADLIIRCHPGRTETSTRYAFHHNTAFSVERLRTLRAALPNGYRLARIDGALYRQCLASPLRDLCSQFADAADYLARGLGFCAVREGTVVGGASSYAVYRGGIEIEVDTLEPHRRKGIATACCAALILECLAQGRTPAWDAANPASKSLAQKLGFRFSHPYPAYVAALPPCPPGGCL